MSKLTGQIAALGAILVTGVVLTACGSSGMPGNAVANVNGTPITVSTFNHWMTVAANASSASTTTGAAAPKVPVPDPPTYTNCIAHLEATAPKPAKGQSKPTAAAAEDAVRTAVHLAQAVGARVI